MEYKLFEFSHGIVESIVDHDMIIFNVMPHLIDCSLHAIVDLISVIASTLGETLLQRFNGGGRIKTLTASELDARTFRAPCQSISRITVCFAARALSTLPRDVP